MIILIEIIERKNENIDVDTMSPLTWAYIGDAVYELYIRNYLINTTKLKPHKLHIESIKYVKAKAQAEILEKLMDNLTEKEMQKITICLKMQLYKTICIQQHLKL